MSLIMDGNAVPNTGNVTYNGTNLTKVLCNGTEVWKKQTTVIETPPSSTAWTFWVAYLGNSIEEEGGFLEWTKDLTDVKSITITCSEWNGDGARGASGRFGVYIEIDGRRSSVMEVSGWTDYDEDDKQEIEKYDISATSITMDTTSITGTHNVQIKRHIDNGSNNFNAKICIGSVKFSAE